MYLLLVKYSTDLIRSHRIPTETEKQISQILMKQGLKETVVSCMLWTCYQAAFPESNWILTLNVIHHHLSTMPNVFNTLSVLLLIRDMGTIIFPMIGVLILFRIT